MEHVLFAADVNECNFFTFNTLPFHLIRFLLFLPLYFFLSICQNRSVRIVANQYNSKSFLYMTSSSLSDIVPVPYDVLVYRIVLIHVQARAKLRIAILII
jgi:hypothetical protein